jgi:predicted aspartyl protease
MLVSTDYPYLQVKITRQNFRRRFRALLDTGFEGYVVLPVAFRRRLGKPDLHILIRVADGTEGEFPAYRAGVEIVGLGVQVVYQAEIVLLGDECLIGQGIIKHLKVTFDHGNQVLVES